jgi:hypothetical protein
MTEVPAIHLYWTPIGQKPGTGTHLGVARYTQNSGWMFHPDPEIRGNHRPSRRYWPTWEECLPRWTGGLDATTSKPVYEGERHARANRS